MKKYLLLGLAILVLTGIADAQHKSSLRDYTLVVEGFDWGAAASKVILSLEDSLTTTEGEFNVRVTRSSECSDLAGENEGDLDVLYQYISDEDGGPVTKGKHITLVLLAAPFETLNAPVKYFFRNPTCPGNQWIDFKLTIQDKSSGTLWDNEVRRILPLIDQFDITGSFTDGKESLTFAAYEPRNTPGKRPLIIWLHGGGEGGNDPTIPLIANRAANYASSEIQAFFDGAYVLVPQSPTFWMDDGQGQYTFGDVNDRYNQSLMALIQQYVADHPQIDQDRIYLGGCSNGGYMTLKLMLLYPDYFAAAFPSALAFQAQHLSDADIEILKDLAIWFIHSKDDPVTLAAETVVPLYHRLMDAGAKNVHFSYFDHVVDISGLFGGDDYHYNGHFSWIYSHTNRCQLDYDGSPVEENGQPVSLMGWLAQQARD